MGKEFRVALGDLSKWVRILSKARIVAAIFRLESFAGNALG